MMRSCALAAGDGDDDDDGDDNQKKHPYVVVVSMVSETECRSIRQLKVCRLHMTFDHNFGPTATVDALPVTGGWKPKGQRSHGPSS